MTPAGQWAAAAASTWPPAPGPPTRARAVTVPDATGLRTGQPISTQETFGRILVNLSRDEAVAPYLVTTAPDVATSTNLAGLINRIGVFAPDARRSWNEDPCCTGPRGPPASTSSWASAR